MRENEKPTFYAKVSAAAMILLLAMAIFGVSVKFYINMPQTVSFNAKVINVIDGDTLILDGFGKSVRLLGIDTPELHHPDTPIQRGAKEARDYLAKRVLGKEVKITYIKGNARDKYGRLLALVEENGSSVNEELVAKGYAFAYEGSDLNKELSDKFLRLEAEAKKKRMGVWAYE